MEESFCRQFLQNLVDSALSLVHFSDQKLICPFKNFTEFIIFIDWELVFVTNFLRKAAKILIKVEFEPK
jgi:hypothetical protein